MTISPFRLARHVVWALALAVMPVAGTGLIGSSAAQAQAQYPLTAEIVENFIASFPEIMARSEALNEQYDVEEGDPANPIEAFGAYMSYQGAMAELNGIVTAYGFTGFSDWIQAASSIAFARAFAQAGGQIDSRFAEAIEQIRNNPDMTDEQKNAAITAIQSSAGAMNALRPSQENIEAVEPYADELNELFENS
jgi:hypothetical protein